jgi:hypothetical protein
VSNDAQIRAAARALRRHGTRMTKAHGTKPPKLAIVTDADPLTAEMVDHNIQLDEDDLMLTQKARRYIHDYGINAGDTLVLLQLDSDDFAVVEIVSETDVDNTLVPAGKWIASNKKPGDAFPSFRIDAEGKMEWGSGDAAPDTKMYRYQSKFLAVEGQLWVGWGTNPGDSYIASVAGGDGWPRVALLNNGYIHWGPGNAGVDTWLARAAAGLLLTNAQLRLRLPLAAPYAGADVVIGAPYTANGDSGFGVVSTTGAADYVKSGFKQKSDGVGYYRTVVEHNGTEVFGWTQDATPGFQVYGLGSGKFSVGGVDSGGSGYRVLRVPN